GAKEIQIQRCDEQPSHHTNEISVDRLIVRRGQGFTMTLDLQKPFDSSKDQLIFTAATGTALIYLTKTLQQYAVWKAEFCASSVQQKEGLSLEVKPPVDAPIGKYTLSLKIGEKESSLGSLVVLFNPWCKDDSVFMPDDKKRQEYVMNEQGVIYKGSKFFVLGASWDFGQFEDKVLDICLKMLDLNSEYKKDPAADVAARCDPIYVSRVISAMINSDDDDGVLEGRWEGDFSDGILPTCWNSSVDILLLWQEQDYKSVKYGQCWVFAGIMCSVMRCLGIPCRVVTNFCSAYDANLSLTIDVFRDEEGVRTPETEDSIWNFHVWVEGWMKRPDLTEDGTYDGWQVLDATPQDKSEGVYRCGPAPVKAILNGDTHLKYDVPFIFSEVNADCVEWLVQTDGSKVQCSTDAKKVGKKISTKCVGSNKRHDITRTYKHKEGGSEIPPRPKQPGHGDTGKLRDFPSKGAGKSTGLPICMNSIRYAQQSEMYWGNWDPTVCSWTPGQMDLHWLTGCRSACHLQQLRRSLSLCSELSHAGV
uniref:Protein-glutamine gamma-glutamyltransferase 2 n=1 Tax=Myripristis murdjan TaxID=586833 RepID=A0A667Y9L4_9TELE